MFVNRIRVPPHAVANTSTVYRHRYRLSPRNVIYNCCLDEIRRDSFLFSDQCFGSDLPARLSQEQIDLLNSVQKNSHQIQACAIVLPVYCFD
ncbi:hypothetical protein E3N88_06367 [Mikania micrantha]|uniref:Uncharacterized protein n=1 Tax=Mikania micrantha TaxID=192012 RepID=A0A5N6PPA9_9ASTR|nr:hypothetical protein E3N88_06367 [Mikania micrantha]